MNISYSVRMFFQEIYNTSKAPACCVSRDKIVYSNQHAEIGVSVTNSSSTYTVEVQNVSVERYEFLKKTIAILQENMQSFEPDMQLQIVASSSVISHIIPNYVFSKAINKTIIDVFSEETTESYYMLHSVPAEKRAAPYYNADYGSY